MSFDRVHLDVDEARALGERALRGIGYDAEDARIIADHVIDAALCGYEYSGLAKILNIPEHRRFAQPRQKMRILHETEVSALYDGGNNVGMLAMYHGAKAAIAKAQKHGFSLIGVTNSWMSGRSAYFVEMIARADLVTIHTASSAPTVAPFGGARPALGANPIAFAVPTADGPLVLDIGTSAFMATELQLRVRLGTPLPEGVGHRPRRQPDPRSRRSARRRAAAVRRRGGRPEGFGLALIVQAFGILAAPDRRRGRGGLPVHHLPAGPAGAARSQARGQRLDRASRRRRAPTGWRKSASPASNPRATASGCRARG